MPNPASRSVLHISATSAEGSRRDGRGRISPDLFTAMQQQLGLKLAAEKTAVDVIAIDHVVMPSPN